MNERRILLLTILLAAWAMAFAYAFVFYATTAPTGDGFLRGANRINGYFGWQGVAGMIAVAVYGVGKSWPKGTAVRNISILPFALAILHGIAIAAILFYARMG
ncbi:MAG: hypothetical protein OXQ92_01480 [Boseongicola sp.]|nr:hypothetical protein [Boseongicola sp.]MDD9979537.1 hypothetical protein [Boseongicola sp.]